MCPGTRISASASRRDGNWRSMPTTRAWPGAATASRLSPRARLITRRRFAWISWCTLKPTDVLRIAVECNGGPYVLGPLHLYGSKPADSVAKMFSPVDQPWPHWLLAQWGTTNYDGPNKATATVIQPCVMTNPGVLPRTVTLKCRARDYLMAPLMGDVEQTFVIAPGQTVTKEFRFKPSDTGRDRLTVLVESPRAGRRSARPGTTSTTSATARARGPTWTARIGSSATRRASIRARPRRRMRSGRRSRCPPSSRSMR